MILDVLIDTLGDLIRETNNDIRKSTSIRESTVGFAQDVDPGSRVSLVRGHFDNPPLNDVLCAEDVRAARLDRDGFGRIHPEIKYAVALQVLRSIATEQIGASATVKALAAATLEVIE